MKKLQQMVEGEEKMRIPIAQGLPWTTDEPEVSCHTLLYVGSCIQYKFAGPALLSVLMYVFFFFCQKYSRLLTT